MRNVLVLVAFALSPLVPRALAAPALPDKPVTYEYAELRYSRLFVGGQMGAVARLGAGPPGGGGVVVAPVPVAGGAPVPATPQTTVKWTTAEEELTFKEWEELADKLGAASPKKESPPTVHKLRVLNKLSATGWELLDRPNPDTTNGVWTFRRPGK